MLLQPLLAIFLDILPPPSLLLTLFLTSLVTHLLSNKFLLNLTHIPGPFFASFTDLYRLYIVSRRRPEQWHIALHKRYGSFVRIGPRTVICADYQAAKMVYALNAGFVKVSMLEFQCNGFVCGGRRYQS
jgi:hypothetical protein